MSETIYMKTLDTLKQYLLVVEVIIVTSLSSWSTSTINVNYYSVFYIVL